MSNIMTKEDVASKIQNTLVVPYATENDIIRLCEESVTHRFNGVMIQPCWIDTAKKHLSGTDIKVCTAFGYPMGGDSKLSKIINARDVIASGADEFDFMPNIGLFKSGRLQEFSDEIKGIVQAAEGKATKIMLEFGMLDEEEKRRIAEISLEAGVTYLKNSSGWGQGGHATIEDVKLLKSIAGSKASVKASGGIRDFNKAVKILEAGADLIGTSGSVKIVTGEGEESNTY